MKTAVIFDVDGTIWDACEVIAESWNACLAEYFPSITKKITYEMIRNACGKTMDEFSRDIFPELDDEQRTLVSEKCLVYEVEYMQTRAGILYPHLEEVLQQLCEEYELYIVSNCQEGYVQDLFATTGIGNFFKDIEYFGRTNLPKDRSISLLMERNHLKSAVYVGDTQGDYNSAVKAGCRFIYAAYGFGDVDADVPAIEDLRELPRVLREMK